ncbi:MAG: DMT family transporter [Candidatus Kapaibacteriales bacterium]
MQQNHKAELMLILMTAIWGATFLVTSEGLNSATPLLYNVLRFALAFVLTLAVFFRKINFRDKETQKTGVILGSIFGVGFALQTYALTLTSISKTAFITALTVVLTPFFYKIVTGKSPRFWPRIGIVVGFIGLIIFTFPAEEHEGKNILTAAADFILSFNPGDLMAILSCFCWALYITLMDKYTKDKESFSFTISLVSIQFFMVMIVNLLFVGIFALAGGEVRFEPNTSLYLSLAFNGVLASFAVTLIHTYYQKYTTPVKAALIFSLEPVFAAVIAYIAINELLGPREAFGAAVLMFGVLISELGLIVQKKTQKLFGK